MSNSSTTESNDISESLDSYNQYGADANFSLTDFLAQKTASEVEKFSLSKCNNPLLQPSISNLDKYSKFMQWTTSEEMKEKAIDNIDYRLDYLDDDLEELEKDLKNDSKWQDLKSMRHKELTGRELELLKKRRKELDENFLIEFPGFEMFDSIVKEQILKRKEYEYRCFLEGKRLEAEKLLEIKRRREAKKKELRKKKEEEDRIKREKLQRKLDSIKKRHDQIQRMTRISNIVSVVAQKYQNIKMKVTNNPLRTAVTICGVVLSISIIISIMASIIGRDGKQDDLPVLSCFQNLYFVLSCDLSSSCLSKNKSHAFLSHKIGQKRMKYQGNLPKSHRHP